MLRKIELPALLLLILLSGIYLQTSNFAAAYPISEIPPKVNVQEMKVNATILSVNGTLWAEIDADYAMHTVYAYGDSYLAENSGMGLVKYPESPYLTVTVTQDVLEAHYPIPLDATNISVELNGNKVGVQQDSHGFFHLFNADLAEINWTVSPVLDDFIVSVHYEHPVHRTTEDYNYLGDYVVALPLYGRYGCSNISYPLYSWYGYPPNNYSIQIESKLADLQVFSVNTKGALTPLNSTIVDGSGRWVTTLCRTQDSSFIHGAVMVFNAQPDKSPQFPVVLAAASIVTVVAIVCAILLVFRRHRKPTINLIQ
jgi:hypothetical protein